MQNEKGQTVILVGVLTGVFKDPNKGNRHEFEMD